jgi:hypothetical protein
MPHEQETSLRNDPATRDDPLFRERSGPARPDQDGYGTSPIGDELAATHPDGPANPDAVTSEASDAPGEWVAGSRGPGYADDDPATLAEPVDPVDADPAGTGGPTDLRATRDPEVAPDTALAADPNATRDPNAAGTPGVAWGTDGTRDPGVAQDPELTRDTGVAPGSETTPANGIPVVSRADATTADATNAGATAADVPAATDATAASTTPPAATTPAAADSSATTPGTPVPGAPGTVPNTGVDAAVAAFVTNGDELHAEWVRIQSNFVDDPRGSVSQAADLVSQVTSSLVTAVQQREQAMRGTWDTQGGGDTDTEHLRNAFRDYRAFFERLAQL